ncbi:unnamed protein product [Lota lota]
MCRFIRYGVSHCLHAAMTRLEDVRGEVSVRSCIRALDYLSRVILLVAICLGIYVRWEISQEANMLIFFVLALVVLGLAIVLYCYFHMEKVSQSLIRLWMGSLLGLLSFVGSPALDNDVKEQATNYLFLTSIFLKTIWALLERICGCTKYRPAFLTTAEWLELFGFASTSFVVNSSPSVTVLVAALAVLMVVLRMKALFALANLICFAFVTELLFFKGLDVSTNPYALACFLSQLICDPLLDFYFSGLSVTERWEPFLAGRGWRRLALLPLLLVVEVTFLVLAGWKISDVGQLYLMIPAFVVCMLFWGIIHLVFLITLWGFHTKISDCQRVCLAQGSGFTSLDKVMASKGVRHFSLISQRLVILTLVSTVIIAALTWQSFSSIFISMALLVLLLESLFHGLFHELGNSLGGTCVGYAVVIPTNYCSLDGQPLLLPPDQVQQLNQRSTDMLNKVQLFFAHHLIENFGCDYSTSGLSLEAMQAKLGSFLELRTADGPRHDTYVMFYSGHTHSSGEWALAGGDTLNLDQIVKWWREKNAGACSRLILVLDVDNALPWARQVGHVAAGLYVAVQGATLSPASDPEVQDAGKLGDFTHRWVEFNCNPRADIRWSEPGRALSAVYGVSPHWGDYSLHLPTESDVTKHWQTYFPHITYPVVQLALWAGSLDLFWGCSVFLRCLRRLKLNWFPPAILDTGQGFKLVRS